MDLAGFADLWEHVRLLSDTRRNDILIEMLERRAPGARVLEVGCGTGLLSCLAARMGATQVLAVEPTAQAEVARALVEANGLSGRVEVLDARIQDLEPRPHDVVFSELLNAEPFAEEVLQAMEAAAPWLAPTGHMSPRRLRVYLALARDNDTATEVRSVRRGLGRMAEQHRLDVSILLEAMDHLDPYRFISPRIRPATKPVCIADLAMGTGERPPETQRVCIPVEEPGPLGSVCIWFEAEIDDGLVMHNGPGQPGHWGHLVLGWADEVGGRAGGEIEVEVTIDPDDGVTVAAV